MVVEAELLMLLEYLAAIEPVDWLPPLCGEGLTLIQLNIRAERILAAEATPRRRSQQEVADNGRLRDPAPSRDADTRAVLQSG